MFLKNMFPDIYYIYRVLCTVLLKGIPLSWSGDFVGVVAKGNLFGVVVVGDFFLKIMYSSLFPSLRNSNWPRWTFNHQHSSSTFIKHNLKFNTNLCFQFLHPVFFFNDLDLFWICFSSTIFFRMVWLRNYLL